MQLPSVLLEDAVNAFAKLPGIGKKTALRMVLHLLKKDEAEVMQFCNAISTMRSQTSFCKKCHNVSDTDLCNICDNSFRSKQVICVVENLRDVIAIENTKQFNGTYHILGGTIAPLDGIGPEQLNIDSLITRVKEDDVTELIFALNATIQGDTTIYYIQKQLNQYAVKITTIARGIAFGGELEFADEMTLAKSLSNRMPVSTYVHH